RGRKSWTGRAAIAHGKRPVGLSGRSAWRSIRDLGNSFPDGAAGQRRCDVYAACGIELACSWGDRRAFRRDGSSVRSGSRDAIDTRGRELRDEGNEGGAVRTAGKVVPGEPEPGFDRGADHLILADAGGGRTICGDTQEAAIRGARLQSRERAS